MRIQYDPGFIKRLKKTNVIIRKSFKEKIKIFSKNPLDPQLNNHALHGEYKRYRSINITADFRAIYEEIREDGEEPVAYFITLGIHSQLYE